MKVAVCLLTADRAGYTASTLLSFRRFNPPSPDLLLLHADDGSATDLNIQRAKMAGFQNVYSSAERKGPILALRDMWACALNMGAEWILHLENDIDWVAPIPERRDADSIRLYGALKGREGPRAVTGPHLMGTKTLIDWQPAGDGWERGVASWGGQPSITRASVLWQAIAPPQVWKIKQLSMAMQQLDTLRPVENITWHVGEQQTPGHYLAKP